jgi:hypothetical protein
LKNGPDPGGLLFQQPVNFPLSSSGEAFILFREAAHRFSRRQCDLIFKEW